MSNVGATYCNTVATPTPEIAIALKYEYCANAMPNKPNMRSLPKSFGFLNISKIRIPSCI